jgi:hypothetical protein
MVVVESHGLRVKLVEVWGPGPGVPVATEIAIALVVGDDEDDVRPVSGKTGSPESKAQEESDNEEAHERRNSGREERFCNSHLLEA